MWTKVAKFRLTCELVNSDISSPGSAECSASVYHLSRYLVVRSVFALSQTKTELSALSIFFKQFFSSEEHLAQKIFLIVFHTCISGTFVKNCHTK
jgi:hypothetical protein